MHKSLQKNKITNNSIFWFSIKYSFDPETQQFIAEIPEINLSDYWDNIFEAQNNLFTALELYMKEKYSN